MTGSKAQLKISLPELVQLPLKGFMTEVESPKSGRKLLIEGMGGKRVRIHAKKAI